MPEQTIRSTGSESSERSEFIASRLPSHNEFSAYNGESYQKYKCNIAKHEGSASVTSGLIWEPPYISKADGRSDSSRYRAYTCCENSSCIFIIHVKFLQIIIVVDGLAIEISLPILALALVLCGFGPATFLFDIVGVGDSDGILISCILKDDSGYFMAALLSFRDLIPETKAAIISRPIIDRSIMRPLRSEPVDSIDQSEIK